MLCKPFTKYILVYFQNTLKYLPLDLKNLVTKLFALETNTKLTKNSLEQGNR